MAFAIKGLYHFDISETDKLLCTFADRILQMYKHESREDWHWFEPYMTYGNSVLSEAMVCAFLKTANPEYRAVALESFDFLLSKTFEGGHIKVISNQGWHLRNATLSKGLGGEQPIDVAYTIMALETFYDTFGDEHYKAMTQQAFYWFLGDNHLNQIVYNSLGDIASFASADRAYIFRYDFKSELCKNTYEWCDEGVDSQIEELQSIALSDMPFWLSKHKKGECVEIEDVELLEGKGIKTRLKREGIKSLITLPLMDDGQVLGFVGFDLIRNKRTFSNDEKKVEQLITFIKSKRTKSFKPNLKIMIKK
jgi:hypothetical protein